MGGKFNGRRIDDPKIPRGPSARKRYEARKAAGQANRRYTLVPLLNAGVPKPPTAGQTGQTAQTQPQNAATGGTFVKVPSTTARIFKAEGVQYNEVQPRATPLTEDKIIAKIAGGDKTKGSCASVALAYIGQKLGWNVGDFRDGKSRQVIAKRYNSWYMFKELGAHIFLENSSEDDLTDAKQLLKKVEEGKEYYFATGRHAAIVRKKNGRYQYLELQHPLNFFNRWRDMDLLKSGDYKMLQKRFDCTNEEKHGFSFMVDISTVKGDKFRTILGYINTNESEQQKGSEGSIK